MKTKGRVTVAIGSGLHKVGELIFETDHRRQSSVFTYAKEWLTRPGAFALAPSMPLSEYPVFSSGDRSNRRSALPGALSDTTPDSWGRGIIQKALGHPPNEFEYLLAVNDLTRQGAIRLLDERGRALSFAQPPTPRLNDISNVMQYYRAIEANHPDAQALATKLVGSAGSLGGARPKSDFVENGILSIAKFTSDRDTMPIERMEVATLHLAAGVGLRTAKASLVLADSAQPIAIIERFDRLGKHRLHYLSAQTFLGLEEATGGYYTDIVDTMREHCGDADLVTVELKELHDRIMFTILVANNDDHLKNHGFLYADDNIWVLAPAFDINPQPLRHRHLETGISPLSGNTASIEAAIEAAPFFDIAEDDARNRAVAMAEQITHEWRTHCSNTGMTPADIRNYAPAFENEEMQLALGKLGSGMNLAKPKQDRRSRQDKGKKNPSGPPRGMRP